MLFGNKVEIVFLTPCSNDCNTGSGFQPYERIGLNDLSSNLKSFYHYYTHECEYLGLHFVYCQHLFF